MARVGAPIVNAPFANGSGYQFVDNQPYLGGWIRVLTAALAAGTDVTLAHGLRVIPRRVEIIYAGTSYCGRTRVGGTAWNRQNVTFQSDTAQPIGTVVFIW